ncbi:CHAT domain-containing protein [Pleurocapsales cyanobacterium LEGE 10410]|nr:CHAT domain-containing protein [Pleurocapsales cyanobacterium LEGE 10410]
MFFKLRQRSLLLFVFGLSISLFLSTYNIPSVLATTPSALVIVDKNAAKLESLGKYYYTTGQFEQAANLWQQAVEIYVQSEDPLSQGRVLSNLALAYSQLNNWSEASQNIVASLDLVNHSQATSSDKIRALAQIVNNQGILQLNQGKEERAIATWEQAKIYYQQAGEEIGVIRASINQASAFKQLGFYRRALKTLTEVEELLRQQPDSPIKVAGLRSYGKILRLVGQVTRSQEILEQSLTIASRLELPNEQIKILLELGNTYKANKPGQALELYEQGLNICQQQSSCLNTELSLQAYLAKLNVWTKTSSEQYTDLIAAIETKFEDLPVNRVNIDRKINFAHSLIELRDRSETLKSAEISQLLEDIIQQAQAIKYKKGQSYGWGLQGQIEEELNNWSDAQKYTERALILAQSLNTPEVSYLWQWQLGRIYQALGDRLGAIAYYSQAVDLLKSLSRDLVAIDPDVQYSFRDGVEPVYRGLVSLLLANDSQQEVSQTNLEVAREVIESLQLAELNNFFREACLDAQTVDIDNIDRQAAVVYPIILSDRLEVIVSLPDRPLKHYTTQISQEQLELLIEQFRYNLVVRSRRDFYRPARQLYDLVVRPALNDLADSQVKTLIFVPDGAFRNIPLGALYDGERYLIEDYSIALTPGLQLLNPRPLEQVKLKTIAAGLTKGIRGFSALNYVYKELEQIEDTVSSVVLLNQDFTSEALKKEIKFSNRPIVHIATHGQFSSSIENTFLLAWDERINIDELDNILQTRNPSQENAIELLVLSACETATGDERAALGLAGMAVRAGARSTLATLWSVNDRATAQLMSDFYHELSDKQLPKAEAVRQAQLSLLKDPWHKHPFYWAPYVLLGNWL